MQYSVHSVFCFFKIERSADDPESTNVTVRGVIALLIGENVNLI